MDLPREDEGIDYEPAMLRFADYVYSIKK
jgi:hypothetical protein